MSEKNRLSELISSFGTKVTFYKFLEVVTRKFTNVHYWAMDKKQRAIVNFLYDDNRELVQKFNTSEHELKTIGSHYKVWIFWWQGFDNAPEMVRLCKKSVERYIPNEKLVFLDSTNYEHYVDVPQKYVDLLNDKNISITQFSDLLRLNLLYQQGGLWLDATYFLTDNLPSYIPELSFFSINHQKKKEVPVSRGLWAGSAIAFSKENSVLKLILDMYANYYSKRNVLIDYLLTDHLFSTCYDYCPLAKLSFSSVPINNKGVDNMLLSMNEMFSPELYSQLTKQTSMHKLNWKMHFEKKSKNKQTLYGYLVSKIGVE